MTAEVPHNLEVLYELECNSDEIPPFFATGSSQYKVAMSCDRHCSRKHHRSKQPHHAVDEPR